MQFECVLRSQNHTRVVGESINLGWPDTATAMLLASDSDAVSSHSWCTLLRSQALLREHQAS
jgi:hypothetical protein